MYSVPKTLKDRWYSGRKCGLEVDRNTNSAVVIKKVDLGVVLTLKRGRSRRLGEYKISDMT